MLNLLKNIFLGEPLRAKLICETKLGKPSFDDITAVTFGCYPAINQDSFEDDRFSSAYSTDDELDSYNSLSLDSDSDESSKVEYDENVYTFRQYPQFRAFDNKLKVEFILCITNY
jgi:hypothetical protein